MPAELSIERKKWIVKKIEVVSRVADYLKEEARAQEEAEPNVQAKRIFCLFIGRFYDCIMGMAVLTDRGLTRQARIVARHALECLCYMGALAGYPNHWRAIAAQESFQRNNIRFQLLKANPDDSDELRDLIQRENEAIVNRADELDALSTEIAAIKARRGWPRCTTNQKLNLIDLALCSNEVFDVYASLYRHLNLSSHVFLPNLVQEHGGHFDYEDEIDGVGNAMNDAMVLIATALQEFDRLFGTDAFNYSDNNLVSDWPSEED